MSTVSDFITQARARLKEKREYNHLMGYDTSDLAIALSALEVAWEALGWYAGFEISHKWEGIVSPNTPFSKYIEGKSQPISPAQQAQAEINRLLNEDKK